MFDNLTDSIGNISEKIRGSARVTEEDLNTTLRDMRMALLEADVALPVVKHLIDDIRERALGAEVAKSLNPGQVIIKIVHDALAEILGGKRTELNTSKIPSVIMLCGLQGAGKTTTAGKLAKLLTSQGKKVAMTSVDATRPAAREQLEILAGQVDVPYLHGEGTTPADMAVSALRLAQLNGSHILILDTAGRQVVDSDLMDEIFAVSVRVQPTEQLLVLDSMVGQTALPIATQFHERLQLTGCILTKTDADVRGGAALSVAHATKVPVRFVGTGEKIEAFEAFDPQRMAGRILGQGDIVGLVEKVQAGVDQKQAEKLAEKVKKGSFDLMDFAEQIDQMKKMGGMASMMKMLPGVKLPADAMEQMDDKPMRRMQAIIYSMTPKERVRPALINGSRKKRIAAGSGTTIQDINKLLKQFTQMQKMMKKMKGGRGKQMMRSLAGRLGIPGGMPPGGMIPPKQ
ncbi:MAG: signal recognition particle protein [Zetaproteobacteria bacterium]|nr:signal recognition particle protein [Zetaproteobacteria bacterium]